MTAPLAFSDAAIGQETLLRAMASTLIDATRGPLDDARTLQALITAGFDPADAERWAAPAAAIAWGTDAGRVAA